MVDCMNKERAYHSNPEILGGTLVFKGTRVPVQSLFDHLKAGDSIAFPSDCRYAFVNHGKGNLSFILNVVA